jgi:hypothetical protein
VHLVLASVCYGVSNGLFLCSYSWGFLPSFCFNIRHHNKGGNFYERESVSYFLFLFSPQFSGYESFVVFPPKKKEKKEPFFCDIYTKRKENFQFLFVAK